MMALQSDFRSLFSAKYPVQVAGVFDAYTALAAAQAGHQALYLSGGRAVAQSRHQKGPVLEPLTALITRIEQVQSAADLPLLVGLYPSELGRPLAQAIEAMEAAGVAAIHLDDHGIKRPEGGWSQHTLISKEAMTAMIAEAVAARTRPGPLIVVHTDAFVQEGVHGAIARAADYVVAGAEAIMVESVLSECDYQLLAESVSVPIIAKIDDRLLRPSLGWDIYKNAGIALTVYPLSGYAGATGDMHYVYEALLDAFRSEIRTADTEPELSSHAVPA